MCIRDSDCISCGDEIDGEWEGSGYNQTFYCLEFPPCFIIKGGLVTIHFDPHDGDNVPNGFLVKENGVNINNSLEGTSWTGFTNYTSCGNCDSNPGIPWCGDEDQGAYSFSFVPKLFKEYEIEVESLICSDDGETDGWNITIVCGSHEPCKEGPGDIPPNDGNDGGN